MSQESLFFLVRVPKRAGPRDLQRAPVLCTGRIKEVTFTTKRHAENGGRFELTDTRIRMRRESVDELDGKYFFIFGCRVKIVKVGGIDDSESSALHDQELYVSSRLQLELQITTLVTVLGSVVESLSLDKIERADLREKVVKRLAFDRENARAGRPTFSASVTRWMHMINQTPSDMPLINAVDQLEKLRKKLVGHMHDKNYQTDRGTAIEAGNDCSQADQLLTKYADELKAAKRLFSARSGMTEQEVEFFKLDLPQTYVDVLGFLEDGVPAL